MSQQATFNFLGRTTIIAPQELTSTISEISRPIHYLGSKLRIVDLVREVVDDVEPTGGAVCDLFAGSGTVSRELSESRSVVAVDIQEYSRVLCSALLNAAEVPEGLVDRFIQTVRCSDHAQRLAWAIQPMVDYEIGSQRSARNGEIEPLCQMLEYGSVFSFQRDSRADEPLAIFSALEQTVARLRECGMLNTPAALTTRYFGGVYFSYLQASQIDSLLEGMAIVPASCRDTFVAAILSTASEIVNTVGKQFAQPIRPRFSDGRPKPNLPKRLARDRTVDAIAVFERWITKYCTIPHSPRKHRVIRGDYAAALQGLNGEVSVVYADPPYTRDHYSRFYHVLETLCLRDCPEVSTVRVNGRDQISRGIYRAERYQSPFCIKSQAPNAFARLFGEVKRLGVPLVLSYSPFDKSAGAHPRLMGMDQIAHLARKSFRQVEILAAGNMAHSKLNRSDKNKAVAYGAEKFLICQP